MASRESGAFIEFTDTFSNRKIKMKLKYRAKNGARDPEQGIKISRRFSREGGIGVESHSFNQVKKSEKSLPHLEIVSAKSQRKEYAGP